MKRNDNSGRDERFRVLYQKYYWRVVRYYMSAFRFSQEDAEELAQDAFTRFYEAMGEYRGDAEWAFFETIARNVAFNWFRAAKTRKRSATVINIDDPEARKSEPVAPAGPDYADREEAARQRRLLRDAIDKLSPAQRECLLLWVSGYKYIEISKILRISMDAVKSRIRDAKRILREKLGEELSLPEDES